MTVEVCPICDIAECRHIRERKSAWMASLTDYQRGWLDGISYAQKKIRSLMDDTP